jgi:hypothetical protein
MSAFFDVTFEPRVAARFGGRMCDRRMDLSDFTPRPVKNVSRETFLTDRPAGSDISA